MRTRGLRRESEGRGRGERGVEDAAERRHEVRRDGLAGGQALVDERLVLQLLPLRRRERVPARASPAARAVRHHHHHLRDRLTPGSRARRLLRGLYLLVLTGGGGEARSDSGGRRACRLLLFWWWQLEWRRRGEWSKHRLRSGGGRGFVVTAAGVGRRWRYLFPQAIGSSFHRKG
jgi:hypothetical protein